MVVFKDNGRGAAFQSYFLEHLTIISKRNSNGTTLPAQLNQYADTVAAGRTKNEPRLASLVVTVAITG